MATMIRYLLALKKEGKTFYLKTQFFDRDQENTPNLVFEDWVEDIQMATWYTTKERARIRQLASMLVQIRNEERSTLGYEEFMKFFLADTPEGESGKTSKYNRRVQVKIERLEATSLMMAI